MNTLQSVSEIFESMLGNIKYSPDSEVGKLYPFFIRCGCVKRRPPRHPFFEWIIDMGRRDVEKVMNGESLDKKELTFVFPERWMGVAEQQAFTHVLSKHPDAEKIEQVDIITSSPMLIGSFMREQILVLSWEDDDKYSCGNGV
jgi:hypothetical protein